MPELGRNRKTNAVMSGVATGAYPRPVLREVASAPYRGIGVGHRRLRQIARPRLAAGELSKAVSAMLTLPQLRHFSTAPRLLDALQVHQMSVYAIV